jgi:outer membrane lipoprotein LolB
LTGVRLWLAALLCLFLAACATPRMIATESAGAAFDRAGRFAVTVDRGDGKPDAVQGGFAWHDSGRTLMLDLANPLGSILARVEVVPGHAVLTRSDGTQERAKDPDALVALVLGSDIPVADLRDWLQGKLGAQPVQALKKDADGRISGFRQGGWDVQMSRYDDRGPRLLQLKRNDVDARVNVRLAVDSE